MKAIYTVGAILVCGILSGCALDKQPRTPEENAEQAARMRYMLNETSPRNRSDLPKVTPEISQSFSTGDAEETIVEDVQEPSPIVERMGKKKTKSKPNANVKQ